MTYVTYFQNNNISRESTFKKVLQTFFEEQNKQIKGENMNKDIYLQVYSVGLKMKIKVRTKNWASSVHQFATLSMFHGPATGKNNTAPVAEPSLFSGHIQDPDQPLGSPQNANGCTQP